MAQLPRPDDIQSADPGTEFETRSAQLGDGYERVAKRGLNNVKRSWRLSWVPLHPDEAQAIIDVIEDAGGVDPIQYTPPTHGAVEKSWLANSLAHPYVNTTMMQVTVTLTEFH